MAGSRQAADRTPVDLDQNEGRRNRTLAGNPQAVDRAPVDLGRIEGRRNRILAGNPQAVDRALAANRPPENGTDRTPAGL
jgi:hypothetical protein